MGDDRVHVMVDAGNKTLRWKGWRSLNRYDMSSTMNCHLYSCIYIYMNVDVGAIMCNSRFE